MTTGGTAEFGFSIQQPAPVITAVDQLAGVAGDVITLTGTTFDNVTGVSFGTARCRDYGQNIDATESEGTYRRYLGHADGYHAGWPGRVRHSFRIQVRPV